MSFISDDLVKQVKLDGKWILDDTVGVEKLLNAYETEHKLFVTIVELYRINPAAGICAFALTAQTLK